MLHCCFILMILRFLLFALFRSFYCFIPIDTTFFIICSTQVALLFCSISTVFFFCLFCSSCFVVLLDWYCILFCPLLLSYSIISSHWCYISLYLLCLDCSVALFYGYYIFLSICIAQVTPLSYSIGAMFFYLLLCLGGSIILFY